MILLLTACGDKKNGTEDSATDGTDDIGALIAEVDQRIISSPRNADLFAERARLNARRDSVTQALNDWKRAIALDSTKSEFHLGIGDLFFQKVRMEEAERYMRKASELDPKAPEPRLKLAEIKLLERNYKEAMGWANDALRLDQQNARGYFLKGWIHMEAGDTTLAISSYRTAVEQDPSMQEAFVQLGVLHAAKGDPLAMQYYRTALDLDPNSTETLYALGMFAQENGLDSLAISCYDRIKELDPKEVLAWYNSGYIYLEHKKDPNAARAQFTRAIGMSPKFTEAYFNRGLAYELEGKLDSSYMDYRKALTLQPNYTPAAIAVERLQTKGLRVQR
ncbi:MAG: tetratricopeptide repeat protein [Bacteroidota bacterium]|nr:tetratricopeptide repeat protein [Bacteroidota bacterium]